MKRNILFLIVAGIFVYIASTGSGCDTNNPTGPTTVVDTNVKVYSGRVITGYMGETSLSGINLLHGTIVESNSAQKDLLLKDFNGTNQDWFLRSGSKSDNMALGYETRFKMLREYDDLSKERFDTISRIKNIGTETVHPTTKFFDIMSTASYTNPQYFNPPLSNRMVLSFYLKGRYENGVTQHPVWGLIHLEKMEVVGGETKLTVNVKINTRGENQFLRERVVSNTEE